MRDIFSKLNRSIFQKSLKYIKLVIPKVFFLLILSTTKLPDQFSDFPPSPSPAKAFLNFLTPTSPQAGGACHDKALCTLTRKMFDFQ